MLMGSLWLTWCLVLQGRQAARREKQAAPQGARRASAAAAWAQQQALRQQVCAL
jgi:hypothetical protein